MTENDCGNETVHVSWVSSKYNSMLLIRIKILILKFWQAA